MLRSPSFARSSRIGSPSSSADETNFRHLVWDIAWFGLALAATTRFMQFYAIRIGADAMEQGWLTALPSLVLLVTTGFSAWWRGRYETSLRALWWPAIGHRFVFLLPAFTPFFPDSLRLPWLILSTTLPAMPQGVAASVFVVMMREAVSSDRLTPLLARRAVAMNICIIIGSLAFGVWLEWAPFPFNYQVMFVAAFIFAMMSQWHLAQLRPYHKPSSASTHTEQKSIRQLLRSPYFISVLYVTAITHIAFFSMVAVVPMRLEALGATEGFIALYGIAELAASAFSATILGIFVKRYGNRTVVAVSMGLTGIASLILAFTPSLEFSLVAGALSGGAWSAAAVGVLGFFAERTADDDIKSTTLWHQAIFLAMFLGPIAGTSLVSLGLEMSWVLVIGAGLRIGAGILTQIGLALFTGKRVEPLEAAEERSN